MRSFGNRGSIAPPKPYAGLAPCRLRSAWTATLLRTILLPHLQNLYAAPSGLYGIFRPIGLVLESLIQLFVRMTMDIVYLGAIVGFLLVTCALAAGEPWFTSG